jgi:hypothetical protein
LRLRLDPRQVVGLAASQDITLDVKFHRAGLDCREGEELETEEELLRYTVQLAPRRLETYELERYSRGLQGVTGLHT